MQAQKALVVLWAPWVHPVLKDHAVKQDQWGHAVPSVRKGLKVK
jgi:hypothetical protein